MAGSADGSDPDPAPASPAASRTAPFGGGGTIGTASTGGGGGVGAAGGGAAASASEAVSEEVLAAEALQAVRTASQAASLRYPVTCEQAACIREHNKPAITQVATPMILASAFSLGIGLAHDPMIRLGFIQELSARNADCELSVDATSPGPGDAEGRQPPLLRRRGAAGQRRKHRRLLRGRPRARRRCGGPRGCRGVIPSAPGEAPRALHEETSSVALLFLTPSLGDVVRLTVHIPATACRHL